MMVQPVPAASLEQGGFQARHRQSAAAGDANRSPLPTPAPGRPREWPGADLLGFRLWALAGCRIETAMPSRITRDQMVEAIRQLPADASVDDAIERLVFLAKIEEGLEQLDRGEGISHQEVRKRLGL